MGRLVALAIVVALLVGAAGGYWARGAGITLTPQPAAAQEECATFAETGKTVCGVFLAYWRANGGLAQQGLPLTDAFEERSEVDGKTYRVQYFERAVFEHHPEYRGSEYEVLLSLLGREKYLAKYPPPPPQLPRVGQRAVGQGFAVTLHARVDPGVPTSEHSQPKAGNRWVAFDVSIENTGQADLSYNAFHFELKTADNRPYEVSYVTSQYAPRISSGTHKPGDITRGWLVFEIPAGAALATLSYDPTYGKGRVVFDVK